MWSKRSLAALILGLAIGSQCEATVQDALTFDGTGDAFTCPTSLGNFLNTDSWTIAAYVNVDTINGSNRDYFWSINQDATTSAEQMSLIEHMAGFVGNHWNSSDGGIFFSDSADVWDAVICRNDGGTFTIDCSIYAEGANTPLDAGSEVWSSTNATMRLTLGAQWFAGISSYSGDIDGLLAFVTVLSERISDSEMNAWAEDPINTVEAWKASKASTLELWLQDAADIQAGAVQDYSGNNRDCTAVGGATTAAAAGPDLPDLVPTGFTKPFSGPFTGPFGGPFQ